MAGILDKIKSLGRDLKSDISGAITSATGTNFGTEEWSPPSNKQIYQKYKPVIEKAAKQYNVPEKLLTRLLYQESSFDPDVISGKRSSRAGAQGIAQFMPKTAASVSETGGVDPLDPVASIYGAAHYLNNLQKSFPDWRDTLAAYNWGRGNLARKGILNAPDETKNYYEQILTDANIPFERPIMDRGLLGMTP